MFPNQKLMLMKSKHIFVCKIMKIWTESIKPSPIQHQDHPDLRQIDMGDPKTTLGLPRHSPGTARDIASTIPAWPKIVDEFPAGWPRPDQAGPPKRVSADAAASEIERADAA